eukprot:5771323-Prymnesium_polylepis.1
MATRVCAAAVPEHPAAAAGRRRALDDPHAEQRGPWPGKACAAVAGAGRQGGPVPGSRHHEGHWVADTMPPREAPASRGRWRPCL